MDKPKKQIRKAPECEECREREQIVEDVIKTLEVNKDKEQKESKKRSLFDYLQSLSAFNHAVITIKIEITWPKDTQDI